MPVTIQEKYTLPSKGLLYSEPFNPTVKLRSMTTEEEMLLLNDDASYEKMANIIDACIVDKLPISSYDMIMGDYEFLLHKLRIVTYGKDYAMVIKCPNCEGIVESTVDLDKEEVHEYNPEEGLDNKITLPETKHVIELALQTPRVIDINKEKANEKRMRTKVNAKFELLYTLMSLIQTVDGKALNDVLLEEFVKKLPTKDARYLLSKGNDFNGKVGLDTFVIAKCNNCKYEVVTPFSEQPKFLHPEVN